MEMVVSQKGYEVWPGRLQARVATVRDSKVPEIREGCARAIGGEIRMREKGAGW